MPFNPLAKEYAVRLTVGSEVTWYGGDDALMDYDTAHAQFSDLSGVYIPQHTRVNIDISVMRRTPKRWSQYASVSIVYPKRRSRCLRTAQQPTA